ncbi:MAG TPA: beta-galactosidase [Opitutales bacterium]|jgi:beta-galactosidase|nr:beta-galactosidase [Opitutales bacterium]
MNTPSRVRMLKTVLLVGLVGGLPFNPAVAQTAAPAASTGADAPLLASVVPDGKVHKFETRDGQFFIDGQATLLIAGEMHFGRVQPEDWETRIKQAKAMGLNAISFYLFWNQVEKTEGKYDFTGMNDVRRVLKLCQDNGMWCILRPGPYCCAEVDYGGIPWWTAKYPDVKIRTNDPKYVEWSKKYIEKVYEQVGDLQVTKGGPLLMVQIENEYFNGRPANNDYMVSLQKIFQDVGFNVPMFTCDPAVERPQNVLPGVLAEQNGLTGAPSQQLLADLGDFPVYVPEVYTAWFLGWGHTPAGEFTSRSPLPSNLSRVNSLLDNYDSFCFYMFFGGTNYGFMNGCIEYLPVITSYDYGAPIDEAGRTTEKYRALRDLLAQRENRKLPDPPPDPSVIEIPAFKFSESESLLATLPSKPTKTADHTVSMEDLDQGYGFVDYRKHFDNGVKGTLQLKQLQDYGIVMVNGKTVGEAYAGLGANTSNITLNQDGPATLDILVYNLGRVSVITNAASQGRARKGLLGGASLDGQDLVGWDMYSLPYESGPEKFQPSVTTQAGPAFYHATFTVDKLGGTFLDMSNWSFGVVWVNGHNLGRFWDRGSQRGLFVPQSWLKSGANEIVVLELHDTPKTPEITGRTSLENAPINAFPVDLTRDPNAAAFRGGAGAGRRGAAGGTGAGLNGRGRGAAPGTATATPANASASGSPAAATSTSSTP